MLKLDSLGKGQNSRSGSNGGEGSKEPASGLVNDSLDAACWTQLEHREPSILVALPTWLSFMGGKKFSQGANVNLTLNKQLKVL